MKTMKHTNRVYFFAAGLCLAGVVALLVLGCANPSGGGNPPVVYVAGYYDDGSGTHVPCYWKDGARIPLDLPGGAGDGYTSSIAVAGGSVYVAGGYLNSGTHVPCYWKDGGVAIKLDLPGETADGSRGIAESIAVAGTSVYVAGWYEDGSSTFKYVPCYWRNGGEAIKFNLPDEITYGIASSIAVAGTSVYVAGYYIDSVTNVPCYWKDGVCQALPGEVAGGEARSIAVADAVYVAGHSSYDHTLIPWYWKEGGSLTKLSIVWGQANAIAVADAVYVAGFCFDNAQKVLCYWKNGVRTDLELSASVDEGAWSIAVAGASVYVAGDYEDDSSIFPCYWKDGARIPLDLPEGAAGGGASSIVVIE